MDWKKLLVNYLMAVLLILVLGLWALTVITAPQSSEDILNSKIDNLERKLDSLSTKKDSIRTVIITVDKEIIKNEKHYEEVINTIVSQPSSVDSVFSRDYIQKFIDNRIR